MQCSPDSDIRQLDHDRSIDDIRARADFRMAQATLLTFEPSLARGTPTCPAPPRIRLLSRDERLASARAALRPFYPTFPAKIFASRCADIVRRSNMCVTLDISSNALAGCTLWTEDRDEHEYRKQRTGHEPTNSR